MPIITLSEVKALLNITDTSKDTLISTLIPIVQDKVVRYCHNTFDIPLIRSYADTFTFAGTAKTITDSDAQFLNNYFTAGLEIRIKNSIYNDGTYTIKTVTAGVLTTNEALADESPYTPSTDSKSFQSGYGKTPTIIQAIKFPEGIKIPTMIYIDWLSVNNHHVLLNERIGDWSGQYKKESDVLSQFNDWRK